MLGEINLIQWRCVAELVDNSVDAFLAAERGGVPITSPEVNVSVPTSDDPAAKLTVRDNGPGMDLQTLENAVKAGWTGNDPINNLGMFGMGFNIATARLGTVTRVWTTRRGDAEWVGLEINFETLIKQRHFRTPMLSRPKTDPEEQGTEIAVERLKPEQRQWFAKVANRSKLTKELGRAYSTMLHRNGTPVAFTLKLNGQLVRGRNHCIWGGEGNDVRDVQTARYGIIDAYQPIDVRLADRPFCTKCWQWLATGEDSCPACSAAEGVVQRQRRVRGWLGVQRYLHESDFGIDFVRHGRKIETGNKDLFRWLTDSSTEEEYPIDDPRHRGRIVGEIHLDHCRVTYTKDRFDRNDPAWDDMTNLVRGQGPLRPDKAEDLGFGQNTSPLFLLFQAFRRSSPKPKVAGCYKRLLIVPDNDVAGEMAQKFFGGEPEFQTDAKWWELVEEADRQLLAPPTGAAGTPGALAGFGGAGDPVAGTQGSPTPTSVGAPPQTSAPPPVVRTSLASLSREYRDDHTSLRWDIKAFAVEPGDPGLGGAERPWALRALPTGIHEFYVNPRNEIFRSATMTLLDGLLAELSWAAMDFQRAAPSGTTFSVILAALRSKYAGLLRLDPVTLSGEASITLSGIARSPAEHISRDDSEALFSELTIAEQDAVKQRMAARSAPPSAIAEGRFLEFAPRKTLLRFFERHPELFFDGHYWDAPYSALDYGNALATEEARSLLVRYYSSLLTDSMWLAEQDPSELADASRARLLRAALALELLAPTGRQGTDT
ncbi:MAG: hypothetical protein QOE70_5417 [Chthoniobacter sp.]|nr:hypothetical protein [Chthoniobacter sp.]